MSLTLVTTKILTWILGYLVTCLLGYLVIFLLAYLLACLLAYLLTCLHGRPNCPVMDSTVLVLKLMDWPTDWPARELVLLLTGRVPVNNLFLFSKAFLNLNTTVIKVANLGHISDVKLPDIGCSNRYKNSPTVKTFNIVDRGALDNVKSLKAF